MPAHVWNGSAFKKVLRKTMWTGTAWKDIKSSHRWTGSVWETIYSSFAPSGMTKNGTYNSSTNSTWLTVPAWAADAGSTVSSNGVVANGSKSNAVVSGQLSINNSGIFGFPANFRLLVGGVVVKTLTGVNLAAGGNLVPIVADAGPVTSGQIATIQYSIATYAGYATIASGANTYVRIT